MRGRKFVKSDALVYEPGFSSVSGSSVVHGFYVGDNPPRVLTLDLTFDKHPEEVSKTISNIYAHLSYFNILLTRLFCPSLHGLLPTLVST